jgi:hypothetical protein
MVDPLLAAEVGRATLIVILPTAVSFDCDITRPLSCVGEPNIHRSSAL